MELQLSFAVSAHMPGRWPRTGVRVPPVAVLRPGPMSVWLLVMCVGGCTPPSSVKGTVSFDGKPLPAGRVTFLCEGGKRPAISCPIKDGGAYEIQAAPVGRARVSVETFKPQPKPEPGVDPQTGIDNSIGWEDTGPYVPIPKRYASPKTSGLEYTITPGEQMFDIVLTK